MVLYKPSNGDLADVDQVNANFAEAYKLELLNHNRQLIDRAGLYSADGEDLWGEAYIDANGRNDSVDTGSTTAIFDTNKYKTSVAIDNADLTNHESSINDSDNILSNISNFFDSDTDTYAEVSDSATTAIESSGYVGKTFSSRYISTLTLKVTVSITDSFASPWTRYCYVETYDGSIWTQISQPINQSGSGTGGSNTFDSTVSINDTVQGVRVYVEATKGNTANSHSCYARMYNFQLDGYSQQVEVYHTIPSGTFSSTISSSVGKALFEDFETGASVDYKLQVNPEDVVYGTLYDPSSYTNPSNALDGDVGTGATKSITNGMAEIYLGETFASSKYITACRYVGNLSTTAYLKLEKLKGAVWSTVLDNSTVNGAFDNTANVDDTVDGLRVTIDDAGFNGTATVYEIIATERTNTEDSGWLTEGVVNTFTAFTSEPTTLIVRLNPKSVSPTAGYPSIRAFSLRAD